MGPEQATSEVTSARGRYAALGALCMAQLLVVLDNTIVNVALPSIGAELAADTSGLQWVVDAYTLTFAGLLLAWGSLGDRFGRRRVMLGGLFGVGIVSIAGALTHSIDTVIAVRAVMGLFAAAVFPATLALVVNIFPDRGERSRAIAAWSGVGGVAIALGPVSGGWLLEHFSWHSVFWINIPLSLVAVIAVAVFVPESRADTVKKFDYLGIFSSIIGVSLVVYSIIEGPHYGWWSFPTLLTALAGVFALSVFVYWELRTANPVLNLQLFRIRTFSLPAASIAIGYFAMFGFLFLTTQYFQGVREFTPLEFGVASLPFAGSILIGTPIAAASAQRLGPTPIIVSGLILTAIGFYLGGQMGIDGDYLTDIVPSMVCLGFGMGLVAGPATQSIMSPLILDEAGAGAAVNDTTREVGGTLGVAVLGSILASAYTTRIDGALAAVPRGLMSDQEKDVARATVLSVVDIKNRSVPVGVETQRDSLVFAMKSAAIHGLHTASIVATCAVIVCAIGVAVFMPWKLPHKDEFIAAR
ncbi:MFS transporter [Gordonia effusa]|uniref:MFS transporter n=1 Tax=Gordonia effusa TaxID=263908 RepID=UPI000A2F068D|nr:MFS transporter [Gordonia effusa]